MTNKVTIGAVETKIREMCGKSLEDCYLHYERHWGYVEYWLVFTSPDVNSKLHFSSIKEVWDWLVDFEITTSAIEKGNTMIDVGDPKQCTGPLGHSFKAVGLNLAECRWCGMVIMHGGLSQDSSGDNSPIETESPNDPANIHCDKCGSSRWDCWDEFTRDCWSKDGQEYKGVRVIGMLKCLDCGHAWSDYSVDPCEDDPDCECEGNY